MSEQLKHWHSTMDGDRLVRRYIKDEDILAAFSCAEMVGIQGRSQMAKIMFELPVAGQGGRGGGE